MNKQTLDKTRIIFTFTFKKEILRVAKQMLIFKFLQFLAILRSALAIKENSILWKVLKINYLKSQAIAAYSWVYRLDILFKV